MEMGRQFAFREVFGVLSELKEDLGELRVSMENKIMDLKLLIVGMEAEVCKVVESVVNRETEGTKRRKIEGDFKCRFFGKRNMTLGSKETCRNLASVTRGVTSIKPAIVKIDTNKLFGGGHGLPREAEIKKQSDRFTLLMEKVLDSHVPLDRARRAAGEHHGRWQVNGTIPPAVGRKYRNRSKVIPRWLGGRN